MTRHRTSHAFTLTELLVVIAIISLLIGFGSAAWSRAMDSSRQTRCLQTMRSLGSGIVLWSADHNGEWPRSSHSAFAAQSPGWQREILPYLGAQPGTITSEIEKRFFRCPMDPRSHGSSYGLNVFMELNPESDDYAGAPTTWRRVAATPSRTVLLAELATSGDHIMAHFWPGTVEVAKERHGTRSNYLFADGSAATLQFTETYDPANNLDRWNPSLADKPH